MIFRLITLIFTVLVSLSSVAKAHRCAEIFSAHLWSSMELNLFLFQNNLNKPLASLNRWQRRRIALNAFAVPWKSSQSEWLKSRGQYLDTSYWLWRGLSRGQRFSSDAQMAELLVTPNRVGLWKSLKHQLAWEVAVFQKVSGRSSDRDIIKESLKKRLERLEELRQQQPDLFNTKATQVLVFRTDILLRMLETQKVIKTSEVLRLAKQYGLAKANLRTIQFQTVAFNLLPDLGVRTIAEIAAFGMLAYVVNEWMSEDQNLRFNDMIIE